MQVISSRQTPARFALLAALCLSTSACTLTSTATHWNGRVGPDGKPVYVKTHTNIGFNLLIVVPLLGATSLPTQIDVLTEDIAKEKGDIVRMVESTAENYWYGFPPFTWILTPVITTVTADYLPAADVLAKDRAEQEKERREKEEKEKKK